MIAVIVPCFVMHCMHMKKCIAFFHFIIDDYETVNVFLGQQIFIGNNNRKEIGHRMILEFERLCDELYKKGMQTFLTCLAPGDHETFYAHALRWYFPQILKRT